MRIDLSRISFHNDKIKLDLAWSNNDPDNITLLHFTNLIEEAGGEYNSLYHYWSMPISSFNTVINIYKSLYDMTDKYNNSAINKLKKIYKGVMSIR